MQTKPKPRLSRRQRLGVRLARFSWRRLFIRLISLAVILVGLGGIGVSAYAYQRVGRAEAAAREQLLQLSENFNYVSASMRSVSDASTNAGTSADQAKTSLGLASSATRNAAGTLDQTAGVINFTIPGTTFRPLAGVDVSFREQARQLRLLADQVDQTGTTLGSNAGDLQTISAQVAIMAKEMNEASLQLREFAGSGSGPGALRQITDSTRLVIAWSVVIHVLLASIGLCLYLLTLDGRRPTLLEDEDY